MMNKRPKPEEIITKLRQVEVLMVPGPVKHKLSKVLQIRTATYDRARRQFGRGFETVDPTGGAQLAKPATRIPTAKPGPLGNL